MTKRIQWHSEVWDIDKLIPYEKNPRIIRDDKLEELERSFNNIGMAQPININLDGTILSGHARWMQLKKEGVTSVDVYVPDRGLTPKQEEAVIILMNKAVAGEWDFQKLNLEFKESDLLEWGFTSEELNIEILPEIDPNKELIEDEIPDIANESECIITKGMLIELGAHRLLCGDSSLVDDVEKLMGGEKADMLFTDPPYGMNAVKVDGNIGGNRKGVVGFAGKVKCGIYKPIIGDDRPFDPTFLLGIADKQIIWGVNHFSEKLPSSPHWLVWYKDTPFGNDFSDAEIAWTNIEKKTVKVYKFTWAGMTREGNRKDELTKRVHPTQKPVGLFANILNDYNPSSVIDLYLGSGSTLIACEKTNRRCFGMEIDPHYCQVIIERWQKYSNKEAYIINDGKRIPYKEL